MRTFGWIFAVFMASAAPAYAFCGLYVAKADGALFNTASKVVYMRDGDRSVITMVSDYRGAPDEFSLIIPTPSVLAERQINIGDQGIVDHLDRYTAPRLVEYQDEDPCRAARRDIIVYAARPQAADGPGQAGSALGVTVEATYAIGEYDFQMLSAEQSDGLAAWLRSNAYQIPEGADAILADYVAKGMKFLVAKVNLERHEARGGMFLRPIQIAFESPDFMLPIRLGMVNADGPQDLILMTLTRAGRVEATNYLTTQMPTDLEVPLFATEEFGGIYRAAFDTAIARQGGSGILLEYAWDMGWCDPCAADPLTAPELLRLGAYWVADQIAPPNAPHRSPAIPFGPGSEVVSLPVQDVFVTRLHARYDAKSFREDLQLRVTENRDNFQGRYVMRRPWMGAPTCSAAEEYRAALPARFEKEAQALSNLTRWPVEEIRAKMKANGQDADAPPPAAVPWWEEIWPEKR